MRLARRTPEEQQREQVAAESAAQTWRAMMIIGLIAVAAWFGWSIFKPPLDTEHYLSQCQSRDAYEQECKGEKARVEGELTGTRLQWRLDLGDENINVDFTNDLPDDVVEGQRIEVAGRFASGSRLNDPEIHQARVTRVLTSAEDARRLLASRRAARDREALRRRCVGRDSPELNAYYCAPRGGVDVVGEMGCIADVYELEQECRAAGY